MDKQNSLQNHPSWLVYTDGASRGNPGPSGAGIYAVDHTGTQLIHDGFYIGEKTNNQAEYLALAIAVFLLKPFLPTKSPFPQITFIADSELLIRQMSGIYRVKDPIIAHIKKAIDGELEGLLYNFKHVERKENIIADSLANQGINKKKKLSPKILQFVIQHRLPI
ncbi:MAG: ribonuclease HI family protein [bacterium]